MFLSCPLFWLIIKLFETYIDGIVKKKKKKITSQKSRIVFLFLILKSDQCEIKRKFFYKKKKNIYSSFELK